MSYFKKEEKTEFAEMMLLKTWTLSDSIDAAAKKKTMSDVVDAKVKTWKEAFNTPKINKIK